MVYSSLPNKFEKYFLITPAEWHGYKIGYYHVSTVGCSHTNQFPDSHSGPCLRATFYEYVNAIMDSLHKKVEGNMKIKNPLYFPEFPLQRLFAKKSIKLINGLTLRNPKIITKGSIDLPQQIELTFDNKITDPIYVDVGDLKSASNWTFPKSEGDINPTHFDQTNIYSYWLQNFYFNPKYVKIRDLSVIYIAKHNRYVGEQTLPYNNQEAMKKYVDFVNRCWKLHTALMSFLTSKMNVGIIHHQGKKEYERQLALCLPEKEPHKWCKLNNYQHRCQDNVIYDKNVKVYTLSEIKELYKQRTGKNAIWGGKFTKNFLKFKSKFKVEEDLTDL
ncbi:MAG: hypothetical protein ACFFAO_18510 [Candidatus Hermodarchaeota archaeon]